MKVLLIEDNRKGKEWVKDCLESADDTYKLTVTENLENAITLPWGSSFDIIIVDLSIDNYKGIEAFLKIHERSPNIPIIVLAEPEDESLGVEAVKQGAEDFLIKGQIEPNELKRSLNYSVERHKLTLSLAAKARELEEKTYDLQKEKQKLSLAHKIARIGSWEWDLETGKASWSDELFDLHGIEVSKGPFSFRELLSHIHPDDRENVWNVITTSMQTLKPVNFYYRIITKEGAIRTFYSLGEIVVNEEGKPVKVVGTRQDVTERLEEEELQRLAMAATKSYNSVIIASKTGLIEWVNEGFTKLTGYTLDEVKNTHGEVLRRGERTGISEEAEYYNKVMKGKAPVTYESNNYSKSGKSYWTITTLTPVLDSKGEVGRIIAIDTDITERKAMEDDLIRANKIADELLVKANEALRDLKIAKKELEETMQVKEQFLANMSHEIRTPMNAILGFTGVLLKDAPTEEQKQYLEIIKTSGANLLVVVNDILDFSKLSSGKITFEQIEFSLLETMTSLRELLLPKAGEKNLELTVNINNKISDNIIGDPTRLNQILVNLVSNSIKFTEKGGITINVELAQEEKESVALKFSVSDTGIGIADNKLREIFESFTQASAETTRKYGGTGLGLAIVKQLVEQQRGQISVQSEENKGSVFTFTIPYKKGKGEQINRKHLSTEYNKLLPAEGLKVLLVEDNELNAMLALKIMNDWNWKVDVAEDGFIALEKIGMNEYDIVMMDIQLPGMDGYEVTHKIRELNPPKRNIPIIAMTAHALAGEDEKCFKAGMNGYISKPFEPENLYLKILSALQIKSKKPTSTALSERGLSVAETHSSGALREETIVNHNKPPTHTDLTYLKEIAKGSNPFIVQMLNIFIEQTPVAIERMEKALHNKDWKLLRMVVHKIKPSLMFTGLAEIKNDIPVLEEYAAEEKNLAEIPQLVDKIKTVCNIAISELKVEVENYK